MLSFLVICVVYIVDVRSESTSFARLGGNGGRRQDRTTNGYEDEVSWEEDAQEEMVLDEERDQDKEEAIQIIPEPQPHAFPSVQASEQPESGQKRKRASSDAKEQGQLRIHHQLLTLPLTL